MHRDEIDLRYVILLALYGEYLQDEGDFGHIRSKEAGCSPKAFAWALMKLQTEGLIAGCVFQPPHAQNAGKLMGVLRNDLHLTREGVETCDRLLGVQRQVQERHKLTILKDLLVEVGASLAAALIERALGA